MTDELVFLLGEKILMKARKLAKQKVLDKFYPNYKKMGLQGRVRIDQTISIKYGGMIDKISKKWTLQILIPQYPVFVLKLSPIYTAPLNMVCLFVCLL